MCCKWHQWLREYRTNLQERLLNNVMFNLQESIHRHCTNKKMHTPQRETSVRIHPMSIHTVPPLPPSLQRPLVPCASLGCERDTSLPPTFRRSQPPHCPSCPPDSRTRLPRGRCNFHNSPAQPGTACRTALTSGRLAAADCDAVTRRCAAAAVVRATNTHNHAWR